MTGFSVRIQREGRWVNVDLDTLSDAELEDWTEASRSREPFAGWRWAGALARWIRDHVKPEDIERAAGPFEPPPRPGPRRALKG